jgi:hypothetical protein
LTLIHRFHLATSQSFQIHRFWKAWLHWPTGSTEPLSFITSFLVIVALFSHSPQICSFFLSQVFVKSQWRRLAQQSILSMPTVLPVPVVFFGFH